MISNGVPAQSCANADAIENRPNKISPGQLRMASTESSRWSGTPSARARKRTPGYGRSLPRTSNFATNLADFGPSLANLGGSRLELANPAPKLACIGSTSVEVAPHLVDSGRHVEHVLPLWGGFGSGSTWAVDAEIRHGFGQLGAMLTKCGLSLAKCGPEPAKSWKTSAETEESRRHLGGLGTCLVQVTTSEHKWDPRARPNKP